MSENQNKNSLNQDNNSVNQAQNLEWTDKTLNNQEEKKQESKSMLETILSTPSIETKKQILSININSFDDIIKMLLNNEYDFAEIIPEQENVKIVFSKEWKILDEKLTSYPVYSNILIKAKSTVWLNSETKKLQEWNWKYTFSWKEYNLKIQSIPESFWEKVTVQIKSKTQNKTSTNDILTFTWAISFIIFVLASSFITFIVINAQTVEDVMFFNSLWISLNDINDFIWKIVTIVFSSVIILQMLSFVVLWIKFVFTKKEQKKRRFIFWTVTIWMLVLAFLSWTLWMATVKKIDWLPNWQEMSYWEVQLYDNTKLVLDDVFKKQDALILQNEYWNLIWPVTIKFDLTYYQRKQENKWFQVEKYIWDFGDWEILEELTPNVIKTFNDKWTYNIKVTAEMRQLDWKIVSERVENIPSIWIKNIVKIIEEDTNSWWKKVTFDASDLRVLWKIEWYTEEDLNKPVQVWEKFTPPKIIFKDSLFGLYIKKEWKTSTSMDKIFLISWSDETWIDWTIEETRSTNNDLSYDLIIWDLKKWTSDWFIESYKWIFWDIEKDLKNVVWKEEESSRVTYIFPTYWKHLVRVILTDSYGKTKELSKIIDVEKEIVLRVPIVIYDNDEIIKPRNDNNIYYLQDLLIPTKLRFDARQVKTENNFDSLEKVSWNINSWDKIINWPVLNYDIDIEWRYEIIVNYTFKNLKDSSQKQIEEKIYIDAVKKDAILDLQIKPSEEEYAPINIQFDASRSQIKNENITKFIFDYGDWTPPEERDAINQWHLYDIPWDYDIKLTVVTSSWKEYSITKKLILKPRPQIAKITTSLKSAPTYQWIDFSSAESQWQISSYFWDFWDWNISTDANPTHSYKQAWTYKVTLDLKFSNNNTLKDTINISIY